MTELESDFDFWLIQSPSATVLSTDFDGIASKELWPVEEVRGGIAFGDRRCSDIAADGAGLVYFFEEAFGDCAS
jgi:hypothetical protein